MAKTTMKIFGFILVMILLGCCSATVYKVGDSDGWTAREDTYYDWSEKPLHKEFVVGDSLIFEYDPNLNDVTQVAGALEFEFCDSSSPKAVYNTGHDVVTLTEPGYHYFITSNQTQCGSGQRLDLLVVYDPSSPIPPPPSHNAPNLPTGKIYRVGDSKGWKVPQESDFYYNWTDQKHFDLGDYLLFEYDNEANDVLEIQGDLEFISCNPTSPVAVHETGSDLVKLTKPGVHYFISSKTPGHCHAGLKLRVVVEPLPKPLTISRVPKNMDLSLVDRLKSWLDSFRPQPRH